MRTKLLVACGALMLAGTLLSSAGEIPQPKPGSAEFERIKKLVGTWTGKADMGNGPVDMTVTYRLLAGGSVLEERVFEGTPQEMVTMYYDQGGKLTLTHYCIMGNRPTMQLKSSDANSISFDLDPACGIDTAKEAHMHAMKIAFEDPNTITATCRAFMDGKENECKTTLKRSKS